MRQAPRPEAAQPFQAAALSQNLRRPCCGDEAHIGCADGGAYIGDAGRRLEAQGMSPAA